MILPNPILAVRRRYLTMVGKLPKIEIALAATDDLVTRNKGIAQLAQLDQNLAIIRDTLVKSGYLDPVD